MKGAPLVDIQRKVPWSRSGHAWGTEAELHFLLKLGSWVPGTPRQVTRKDLLIRYLSAMRRRVEWGTIDPIIIQREVKKMIAKEK